MLQKFISVKGASELVGISPDMIRSEIKAGKLISKKAGKSFFTTHEWLDKWQNDTFEADTKKHVKTFKYPTPTRTATEIGKYYIDQKRKEKN